LYTKNLFLKKKETLLGSSSNDDRLTSGGFITLFSGLRENPDKFFNYFRMSVQSFDELADKIIDMIKSQDTWTRLCIPPLEMLDVTLR